MHALSKIRRYLGLVIGVNELGLRHVRLPVWKYVKPWVFLSVSKLRASLRVSRHSRVIMNLLSTIIVTLTMFNEHEESLWHWFLYILA